MYAQIFTFPSSSSFAKKERLGGNNSKQDDDEEDDKSQGGGTFAVVENPLYAENEGDLDAFVEEELEEYEAEVGYGYMF